MPSIKGIQVSQETEAQFCSWIEDLFTRFGWQWVHSRPAKTDKGWRTALSGSPGFPDYQAIGPETREGNRRHIVVEVKSGKGRPSPQQVVWLDGFALVEGTETYLVRPSDREEFTEVILLEHVPNLIERALLDCAWVNRRELV